MQRPEHYLKSGRPSPASSTDEEFAQDEQTAGKVPPLGIAEQDTEIVKTHYSPRGVFFVYFQGEASIEVDKHFNQTFSGLCCLPGDAAEKRVDGSRLQGLPSVPMTQRNLPASFWNLPSRDQTPQPPTSYPRHSNSLCLFQQNASEGTTNYSTGCRVTNNASHVSLGRTATNADDTYAFSVSCAQLAAGVVKSFPPKYLQQGPQPLSDSSGPLSTQETDVDCYEMQTSFRFNPSYNDLLIQPEVKPQLPLVPGDPAR